MQACTQGSKVIDHMQLVYKEWDHVGCKKHAPGMQRQVPLAVSTVGISGLLK